MLARSVSRVFKAKVPDAPMAGHATLLEALQAGVAGQLASLGDPGLTSTGESSAEVPEVPVTVLAESWPVICCGRSCSAVPTAGRWNRWPSS